VKWVYVFLCICMCVFCACLLRECGVSVKMCDLCL